MSMNRAKKALGSTDTTFGMAAIMAIAGVCFLVAGIVLYVKNGYMDMRFLGTSVIMSVTASILFFFFVKPSWQDEEKAPMQTPKPVQRIENMRQDMPISDNALPAFTNISDADGIKQTFSGDRAIQIWIGK